MEGFPVGTRPRPYLLPRLRVVGDLLRFEACPLRYRLHAVGGWPEADVDDASRITGSFVHVALDYAGTACRSTEWGGAGLPVDAVVADRAVQAARRAIDSMTPRGRRSDALVAALDRAERVARHAILRLGPRLFPLLAATERRLAATRPYRHPANLGRRRRVNRFEVSGVLDAITVPVDLRVPTDDDWAATTAYGARRSRVDGEPVQAVIDFKVGPRPIGIDGATDGVAVSRGDHAFQVAAYAALHGRFALPRIRVGSIIYLDELVPDRSDGSDTQPTGAVTVLDLDDATYDWALARIDGVAAEIEECHEREATGVPPRHAWPARPSGLCARCGVRSLCPAQPATSDDTMSADPEAGEPVDA